MPAFFFPVAAFAARYSPSCPTRDSSPDTAALLNASVVLSHNARVYEYMARKSPEVVSVVEVDVGGEGGCWWWWWRWRWRCLVEFWYE